MNRSTDNETVKLDRHGISRKSCTRDEGRYLRHVLTTLVRRGVDSLTAHMQRSGHRYMPLGRGRK